MFKKYNDTPATIAMCIWLLGALFFIFQTLFMTETFLSDRGIDVSAIPIERFFSLTWVGFVIGFILTLVYGPDGQKVFFITVLTTQLAWAIYGGYLYFWGGSGPSFDVTPQTHDHTLEMSLAHGGHLTHGALDAVIIAALLFTVFRLKSRL